MATEEAVGVAVGAANGGVAMTGVWGAGVATGLTNADGAAVAGDEGVTITPGDACTDAAAGRASSGDAVAGLAAGGTAVSGDALVGAVIGEAGTEAAVTEGDATGEAATGAAGTEGVAAGDALG